jgi:hypothetical protein
MKTQTFRVATYIIDRCTCLRHTCVGVWRAALLQNAHYSFTRAFRIQSTPLHSGSLTQILIASSHLRLGSSSSDFPHIFAFILNLSHLCDMTLQSDLPLSHHPSSISCSVTCGAPLSRSYLQHLVTQQLQGTDCLILCSNVATVCITWCYNSPECTYFEYYKLFHARNEDTLFAVR